MLLHVLKLLDLLAVFELFHEAAAEIFFVLLLHFDFALDAEFFEFECGAVLGVQLLRWRVGK